MPYHIPVIEFNDNNALLVDEALQIIQLRDVLCYHVSPNGKMFNKLFECSYNTKQSFLD